MSFAFDFDVQAVENDELADAVTDAANDAANRWRAGAPTGAEFDAAVKALVAGAVVALEALGSEWAVASVQFSGHVNPGNTARPGWVNDAVSSSIRVRSYRLVPVA